jgi:hypothetical protein
MTTPYLERPKRSLQEACTDSAETHADPPPICSECELRRLCAAQTLLPASAPLPRRDGAGARCAPLCKPLCAPATAHRANAR